MENRKKKESEAWGQEENEDGKQKNNNNQKVIVEKCLHFHITCFSTGCFPLCSGLAKIGCWATCSCLLRRMDGLKEKSLIR
jgi:hypothetical protein